MGPYLGLQGPCRAPENSRRGRRARHLAARLAGGNANEDGEHAGGAGRVLAAEIGSAARRPVQRRRRVASSPIRPTLNSAMPAGSGAGTGMAARTRSSRTYASPGTVSLSVVIRSEDTKPTNSVFPWLGVAGSDRL